MYWAYLYFMKDEAPHVREVAPHHARYWSETGSAERGGPFSDRSGGLILPRLNASRAEETHRRLRAFSRNPGRRAS